MPGQRKGSSPALDSIDDCEASPVHTHPQSRSYTEQHYGIRLHPLLLLASPPPPPPPSVAKQQQKATNKRSGHMHPRSGQSRKPLFQSEADGRRGTCCDASFCLLSSAWHPRTSIGVDSRSAFRDAGGAFLKEGGWGCWGGPPPLQETLSCWRRRRRLTIFLA